MTTGCVDVIIPAYNAGRTIAGALESVISGNLPFISSILVVDDGSTDDTASIVETFCSQYNYVHLFRTENRGVSEARNFGIAQGRAEWIAFLDADDVWLAGKLSRQLKAAASASVGFVCSPANGQSLTDDIVLNQTSLFFKNRVVTSSVILKRSLLPAESPLFERDLKFAEDLLAWIQILYSSNGLMTKDPEVLYSVSSTPNHRIITVIIGFFYLNLKYSSFLLAEEKNVFDFVKLLLLLVLGSGYSLMSISKRYLSF